MIPNHKSLGDTGLKSTKMVLENFVWHVRKFRAGMNNYFDFVGTVGKI
jgi:hypothetical protein